MIRGYYEIEGGKNYAQIAVLGKLCDMISENKIFDFVVIDNSTLRDRPNNTKCKYGPFNLVVENSENGLKKTEQFKKQQKSFITYWIFQN